MTIIWCMVPEISSATDIILIIVILDFFLPFIPVTTRKSKFWIKMKKTPRDIIILHMSTINKNHMMYDSWDMERGRQKFFSFGTIFALFFFLIGIHPMQGWTATTRHGVTRKEAQKGLQGIENLFRKNLQLKDVC